MRRINTILLIMLILGLCAMHASAQFVVAKDTIRGRIDFCPRPGDINNAILVPNDSVFYMFPPDMEIDPWRYVDYYSPTRNISRGYIQGTHLMRVDDYEMIEVERLSSHGTITFKGNDVRVNISVTNVTPKDTFIKPRPEGGYMVNGRTVKGVPRWEAPKVRYQSISVIFKGRTIVFPKNIYAHLLEPEIENMAVYYDEENGIVYINANNGGTDAYYNALWAVTSRGVANVYVFDPAIRK